MICVFCHSIGPYHAARYSALSSVTHDLAILELSSQWKGYPWTNMGSGTNARVKTLFEQPLQNYSRRQQIHMVEKELSDQGADVVISVGYSDLVMRVASNWAQSHHAVSIMVTDTWKGDKKRYALLELVKGQWCRNQYDAIFIPGIQSYEYYTGLGFPANKIWRGVAVVDNEYFTQKSAIVRNDSEKIRQTLDLPQKYFLCCARLAPEKNIKRLIYAFEQYRNNGGDWELVLVGTGPCETSLRNLADRTAKGKIHFAGWQQYSDLPSYYALASCFILPSISEPWGLVVNEAMASGLPVLISRKCGCSPELCWRGINGYDFDPNDANELARLMRLVSGCEQDLNLMGQNSRRIIANFTPDTWARALLDCIQTVSQGQVGLFNNAK
jgi:1,2-diacylglycerol 3-alpha-glucosyltransferase